MYKNEAYPLSYSLCSDFPSLYEDKVLFFVSLWCSHMLPRIGLLLLPINILGHAESICHLLFELDLECRNLSDGCGDAIKTFLRCYPIISVERQNGPWLCSKSIRNVENLGIFSWWSIVALVFSFFSRNCMHIMPTKMAIQESRGSGANPRWDPTLPLLWHFVFQRLSFFVFRIASVLRQI